MRVRQGLLLLVVYSVASLAILSCAERIASAAVVFRGDFETCDLSQWPSVQRVEDGRIRITKNTVATGTCAARFEVRQGDDPIAASGNRAELAIKGTGPATAREGQVRWFRWQTRFGETYPVINAWQLFAQWHHYGNAGSPPLEFYTLDKEMRLRVAQKDVWRAPLRKDVWIDFVVGVKFSKDPRLGWVEVHVDGKLALPRTAGATMADEYNFLKLGYYRNEKIAATGVLFHDGMTIATTKADVMPGPLPLVETVDAGPPDAAPPPDAARAPDAGPAVVEPQRPPVNATPYVLIPAALAAAIAAFFALRRRRF